MHVEKAKLRYVSYLLRLWETIDNGQRTWRVSLEAPGQKGRLSFASLAEAVAYLQRIIQEQDVPHP